jgi:hypothetical protein
MKILIKRPTIINAARIHCHLPVTSHFLDDQPELREFPGFSNNTIVFTLDLETARVVDWPAGLECDLNLKVVDQGTYTLLASDGSVLATLEEEYVPPCIPQQWGDYVILSVKGDGSVYDEDGDRWEPSEYAVADAFFRGET